MSIMIARAPQIVDSTQSFRFCSCLIELWMTIIERWWVWVYLRILNICCIVINIYECVWVLCIMLGWCLGRWQTWIRALFTFAQVSHSECTEWVYRLPATLHRVLCGELRSPVWASQGGYRYGDDSYEDDLTWEKG